MSTAGELITQIIQSAIETANTYTEQTDTAADRVLQLSGVNTFGGGINGGYYLPTSVVGAIEPDVPEVADSLLTYDAQLNHLVKLSSDQLADYFIKYYPLASDAYDEATSWLINTITNGGTGLPAAVEEQIWQRARDRTLKDGQRLEAGIVTGYAARGFKIAQPSMLYDMNQARYEQHGKIGEAATTVASKQAEIAIETIKFAIGAAIDSRFKAMQAASDYIRSLMTAPDAAARMSSLNSDAKAKMMAATSDLYRARLSRDQLIIGQETTQMQTSAQFIGTLWNARQDKVNGEVQAAAAAAEAYSKVASSALSSLNSIVSTGVSAFE